MSDVQVSSNIPPTRPPGAAQHNTAITPATATSVSPMTPHHQIRSSTFGHFTPTGLPSSPSSTITLSDVSPADIKRKLEQRLADTKVKMYNIGRLGESLVDKERELTERIKEMESQCQGEDVRPELRSKLVELENGFREIERESAKAFSKTLPFLGKVFQMWTTVDY